MNTNPPYLSASRIKTYLMCPMKYRLQYVERVSWAFKPAALVLGTSVHAAVEMYYRARMNGDTLTLDDLKDLFDQAWAAERDPDVPLDTDDPNTVRRQGHDLLQVFFDKVAPRTIVDVEADFRVPLAGSVNRDDLQAVGTVEPRNLCNPNQRGTIEPRNRNDLSADGINGSPNQQAQCSGRAGDAECIDLVGRMDLIETDVPADSGRSMGSGTPVIVDLKTLARKPSETDLLYDLQLSAYAFAARRTGLVPADRDVLLRLDVLTKTKRPAFSQHFTVRTPDSDRRFALLAGEIVHAIRAGAFPPNSGWQCARCSAKHMCKPPPAHIS